MTSTEPSAAGGPSSGSADLIDTEIDRDGEPARPTKVSIFASDEQPAVRARPVRAKVAKPTDDQGAAAPDEPSAPELEDALAAAFADLDAGPTTTAAPVAAPDEPQHASHGGFEDDDAEFDLDALDEALIDDLAADDEYMVVSTGGGRRPRGKLKARKVRRIVRYVSPWSVFKVSLLFSFCLWVVFTIAGVILWQLAVQSGQITNVEKFLAKLLAESSYTIDGRSLFRAAASAGVVLVFAGTGFMVLMALLFNVICDITGGVRFTVLELESTRREIKTRNPAEVEARAAAGEFLRPVNRRGKPIKERAPRDRGRRRS